MAALKKVLHDQLHEYNEQNAIMNLVLFRHGDAACGENREESLASRKGMRCSWVWVGSGKQSLGKTCLLHLRQHGDAGGSDFHVRRQRA